VAKAAFQLDKLPTGMEPGLYETSTYRARSGNFPNGCHVCEVEIDPETGSTQVIGYWVVDDVGTIINPMLVKGQIMGGIAQGMAQVLMEGIRSRLQVGIGRLRRRGDQRCQGVLVERRPSAFGDRS
jgi:aerobic carbon-monoxide dehydrogenase large subunit